MAFDGPFLGQCMLFEPKKLEGGFRSNLVIDMSLSLSYVKMTMAQYFDAAYTHTTTIYSYKHHTTICYRMSDIMISDIMYRQMTW